jgi:peptidyl-prolyl cis-trans isomerase B (cyclophilin B)
VTDRRQRQKQLRAERLQAEKRRASRRELRTRLLVALGIGSALAGGFLVTGLLSNRPVELPGAYLDFRSRLTACGAEAPDEQTTATFEAPTDLGLDPSRKLIATVTTSCGQVVIELDPALSPRTVNSFAFLAGEGFYEGTAIHRIAADFVIQAGDPSADGRGGPGYLIPDEYPAADFVYEQRVVAMANAGSGTTGSQFFIVIGEKAAVLNPTFNVLGLVVSGDTTLAAIAAVPTVLRPGSTEQSLPTETVYIETVEVAEN